MGFLPLGKPHSLLPISPSGGRLCVADERRGQETHLRSLAGRQLFTLPAVSGRALGIAPSFLGVRPREYLNSLYLTSQARFSQRLAHHTSQGVLHPRGVSSLVPSPTKAGAVSRVQFSLPLAHVWYGEGAACSIRRPRASTVGAKDLSGPASFAATVRCI